ncbi:MAG: GNAT family N-acetyltransferase [Bacteroidota bacterium]
MTIELLTEKSSLLDQGIRYFWTCWGRDSNFSFYENCIQNSLSDAIDLPKFYLLLQGEEIIGSYALLRNDIISRQDLVPWFACLHVEEAFRNRGLAEKLLKHALEEAQKMGYDQLYLSTSLDGFYEKKGWTFFADGYGVGGDLFKIYAKSTGEG